MNTSKRKVIRKRILTPAIKQNFSIPSTIIYYMATNPSTPKFYSKLIQQCKYFFEKKPILVAESLDISDKRLMFIGCTYQQFYPRGRIVRIQNQKIKSSLWLTKKVNVFINNLQSASSFCSKLYPRGNIDLTISNTNILLNDFKILGFISKIAHIIKVEIIYPDGSPVMLETIFEVCPHATEFKYVFNDNNSSVVNDKTLKNIAKLQSGKNHLRIFSMLNVPGVFNNNDMFNILNAHQEMRKCLYFRANITEDYRMQLNILVDNLIESQIKHCLISYSGEDRKKHRILWDLCFP